MIDVYEIDVRFLISTEVFKFYGFVWSMVDVYGDVVCFIKVVEVGGSEIVGEELVEDVDSDGVDTVVMFSEDVIIWLS